jgi:hypothetical protein
MITEEAKERCRILAFWEKHGTLATTEAFKISRPTLFRWQKSLEETKGKLEGLNKKSTAPKKRRSRYIPEGVEDYIIRERTEHPRLSKEKLATMMKDDLGIKLSFSKVGRIMRDMKKRKVLPLFQKPKRKRNVERASYPERKVNSWRLIQWLNTSMEKRDIP